jgi:membrane protease YdiL (CAAX protease family)
MKRLGIAATLGLGFIALMLGAAAGLGTVIAAMRLGHRVTHGGYDGTTVALYLLAGMPVQVVAVALAARMTGEGVFAYLALDVPRRRHVAIAVAVLALLIIANDGLSLALGLDIASRFELDVQSSARTAGTLVPLWIGMVVAAPAGEEILFRGFLFRGFVRKPGPGRALPAIVAISLMWAALHMQYDLIGIATVFVSGVCLGYVRLLSGSTSLVILLHMLWNLESVARTMIALNLA